VHIDLFIKTHCQGAVGAMDQSGSVEAD